MRGGMDSPPTPLKFKQFWLEDEDFRKMVKNSWNKMNPSERQYLMKQFAYNLTRVKRDTKKMATRIQFTKDS
jgi:hypothetical protein